MLKVLEAKDYSQGIEEAIKYYHSKWGNENNYDFFHDAFIHSLDSRSLPKLFVLVKDEIIIGCCSLIANDFISRHDLIPWLAGVYIDEAERGNSYANLMMEFARKRAKMLGFGRVYLTTDLDGFYEKYGWERIEDGYERDGTAAKIYMKNT